MLYHLLTYIFHYISLRSRAIRRLVSCFHNLHYTIIVSSHDPSCSKSAEFSNSPMSLVETKLSSTAATCGTVHVQKSNNISLYRPTSRYMLHVHWRKVGQQGNTSLGPVLWPSSFLMVLWGAHWAPSAACILQVFGWVRDVRSCLVDAASWQGVCKTKMVERQNITRFSALIDMGSNPAK